jgi:hypothetical protein
MVALPDVRTVFVNAGTYLGRSIEKMRAEKYFI